MPWKEAWNNFGTIQDVKKMIEIPPEFLPFPPSIMSNWTIRDTEQFKDISQLPTTAYIEASSRLLTIWRLNVAPRG